jgi:diguanylate cyclase (GGDEF)-like protein
MKMTPPVRAGAVGQPTEAESPGARPINAQALVPGRVSTIQPGMSLDSRERQTLRRAQRVLATALMVLGLSVIAGLIRTPGDLLTFVQLIAVLVLAVALALVYRAERHNNALREAREAGMKRMVQGMSRSGSPEAIVESIIDELRRTADADHIVVARLRPVHRVVETTLVSTRGGIPPSRSILPAGVLRPKRPTGARRVRRSASVDGSAAKVIAHDLAERVGSMYALSNTVAAPLLANDEVVGALILSRRADRLWREEDRALLEFSANELSAALTRAFAFEEAEIKANVDALTGLPNRRYLEEFLATIGPRRRSVDRLGILMIDLDHFKRLNDRYGHVTGDAVLQAVAHGIFDAVRADDLPARYGGEEFAVVLRRANSDQAADVAERIRSQIAAIDGRGLGVNETITVSIGVAVADERDEPAAELLLEADKALYRAKREGRNRVVLARASH